MFAFLSQSTFLAFGNGYSISLPLKITVAFSAGITTWFHDLIFAAFFGVLDSLKAIQSKHARNLNGSLPDPEPNLNQRGIFAVAAVDLARGMREGGAAYPGAGTDS
jgi:hypothetical protein